MLIYTECKQAIWGSGVWESFATAHHILYLFSLEAGGKEVTRLRSLHSYLAPICESFLPSPASNDVAASSPPPEDKAHPQSPHFTVPHKLKTSSAALFAPASMYVGESLFEVYLLDRHHYLRRRYSPSSLGHKCSDENQISPYLSKCLTKFQGPSPRLLKIYAMYKVSGIPRIF